jgi:hypothetical protein
MKSGASYHFPPVVYREGKKVLWNRLERKPLANRPEERVRLRYIDYLTLQCGWPSTRISVESAVTVRNRDSILRADLICHDKQLLPSILIECKAESVPLNQKVAEQIALYNRSVSARILCITNGVEDLWFELKSREPVPLSESPLGRTTELQTIQQNREYWSKRGFAGKKTLVQPSEGITSVLQTFWSDELPWKTRYLNIHQDTPEVKFNHYYRTAETSDRVRIAMSFNAGLDGNTYLTAIFNEDGTNRGLLITNLNLLALKHDLNSTIITGNREIPFDLRKVIPLNMEENNRNIIENLPGFLETMFLKKL